MIPSTDVRPRPSPCLPSTTRRHEKIQSSHLERLAVVYVRQSTPQQVEQHQESGKLQYRLKERALDLGWGEDRIQIVDCDLGISAATSESRDGFQSLVGEVTLGHVGVILGVEFDRLARSCGATYQLLDACGLFGTLIADPETVYDPGNFNDRLLLGLKGTMGEVELHLLKRRMHGAKLEKARRGELCFLLPRGYVRRPSGEIVKDPDEEVRHVVELVLEKFAELGTIGAVLRYLVENGVRLGHRIASGPAKGDVTWTRPNRPTLQNLLTNPAYAGAYAYGRRKIDPRRKQSGRPSTGRVTRPQDEWHVLIRDHHPAYISWEQYEANRARLRANYNAFHRTGMARKGAALFAGLLRCGKCGATMFVQYPGREAKPTYSCARQTIDYGAPFCQSLSGKHLEPDLVDAVLELLRPASLELALRAAGDVQAERDRLHGLWEKRLERARYEVDRARRSYGLVEPENRLVVRQLEREWEESLLEQKKLEEEYDRFCREKPRVLTAEERDAVQALSSDVPALWHSEQTTNADRKEILRILLDRVVVDVEGESEKVNLEIHWAGGHVVRRQTIRPVARYEQLSYYPHLRDRIAELRGEGESYQVIADHLNDEGFRPPKR
ncbi:MAG: recombinase family protein, partial [Candidatus Latescibacteria bacterium]|nr:recombinase family protein [Candidatus Latescibacterota bacterium]